MSEISFPLLGIHSDSEVKTCQNFFSAEIDLPALVEPAGLCLLVSPGRRPHLGPAGGQAPGSPRSTASRALGAKDGAPTPGPLLTRQVCGPSSRHAAWAPLLVSPFFPAPRSPNVS